MLNRCLIRKDMRSCADFRCGSNGGLVVRVGAADGLALGCRCRVAGKVAGAGAYTTLFRSTNKNSEEQPWDWWLWHSPPSSTVSSAPGVMGVRYRGDDHDRRSPWTNRIPAPANFLRSLSRTPPRRSSERRKEGIGRPPPITDSAAVNISSILDEGAEGG